MRTFRSRRCLSIRCSKILGLEVSASSIPAFERPRYRNFSTKTTRVYAIGDGWTGCFGNGSLDQRVVGHDDEEEADTPLLVYETQHDIRSLAVGWGHSALIANDQLFLTGRPHEFSSLLKLARLPNWFRRYAVKHTYRTVLDARETQSLHPTDIVGRTITFFSDIFLSDTDWDEARMHSIMIDWTPFDLPDKPVHVSCSAGITSVTVDNGRLYTFGVNGMGQCGTGEACNNVWKPQQVTGLTRFSDVTDTTERSKLKQSHPITTSSLGLQHGLSLNHVGHVFSWGKGSRGQLGFDKIDNESHAAVPVQKAVYDLEANDRPVYRDMDRVTQIAAGMIHSAALIEDSNDVYIWGKNTIRPLASSDLSSRQLAVDAHIPFRLKGLPDRKVLQISCGSHHTSMLLEDGSVWAVGIATDSHQPLFTPVCLMARVELPVRQFQAHMDRTTVVTASGTVLQAHLWEDPANQAAAVFTPAWAYELDDTIQSVHRSWLHTMVITKES